MKNTIVLAVEMPLFLPAVTTMTKTLTMAALLSLKPSSLFSLFPVSGYRVRCEGRERFRGAIRNTRSEPSTTPQLPRLDQVYKKHMWEPTTPTAYANSAWGLGSVIHFIRLP